MYNRLSQSSGNGERRKRTNAYAEVIVQKAKPRSKKQDTCKTAKSARKNGNDDLNGLEGNKNQCA